MKLFALSLLTPSLVASFTVNRTAIPGMTITKMDDGTTDAGLFKRAAPPSYYFEYGNADSCEDFDVRIDANQASPCHDFITGPPKAVRWTNPSNPNDPDNLPYWNTVLFFAGDDCPVVGHPIQCDAVGTYCLRFAEGRPLSYDIVEAATGVRNCDV